MLSMLISFVIGLPIWYVTSRDLGPVWGVVCGVGVFLIAQVVIALLIRKKVAVVNRNLEEIMRAAQVKINRQMTVFQQRPNGNVRMMQQTLENIQHDAVMKTLEATGQFEKFYKWNWLLKKQDNTMRMQLYFQLRDFDKVDALLPKCLLADSRSLLIKLVRLYRRNDPGLDRFYLKKCARLKGEDGALAALTYAWMKLKCGEKEKALAALVDARKSSDNPTLLENHARLVNGKEKHFSNANLGDVWYSLYLEEPKVKVQQQRQTRQQFRMF